MKLKIPGSGDVEISNQMKSLRSGVFIGCDAWRAPKMATTEADFWVDANAAVSSDAHMLTSFPCTSTVNSTLPDYQQMEGQYRSSGHNSGSSDASTGVYFVNGGKGPFTQSQWLELEHQALIYRYITANQPIPIQLLIPIRKAIESAGFYGRWGPLHLGYSSRTDPEPGRCRRTDGKKWRCTKEAMEKKKYCDKHISRGRNRSRKQLECQATKSSRGKNPKTIRADVTTETSLNRMIVKNRDSSGSSFTISKHQNSSPEAPQRNICNNPKEFESQDSLYTLLDNNNIGVEFMSSSYSPNNEKVSFASQWEASIGGPLAEALQSKISNNTDES